MGGLVKGTQKPYWSVAFSSTTPLIIWLSPFYKTESVVETDSTHGTKAHNQWY